MVWAWGLYATSARTTTGSCVVRLAYVCCSGSMWTARFRFLTKPQKGKIDLSCKKSIVSVQSSVSLLLRRESNTPLWTNEAKEKEKPSNSSRWSITGINSLGCFGGKSFVLWIKWSWTLTRPLLTWWLVTWPFTSDERDLVRCAAQHKNWFADPEIELKWILGEGKTGKTVSACGVFACLGIFWLTELRLQEKQRCF